MSVTRDLDIQALPGWQVHLGTEGGVADAAPTVSTMTVNSDGSASFYIAGPSIPAGKVAGADYYLARPIPPGAVNLCMRYVINVDGNHDSQCNSDENDCIFTDQNNLNYNGSVQNDNSTNPPGMMEVSNPNSGWVKTGILLGRYTPNVDHELLVLYSFDFTRNKTLTTTGFVYDYVSCPVPPNIATVPGVDKGWKDSMRVMVQLQQMLKKNGTNYTITYRHVDLTWS